MHLQANEFCWFKIRGGTLRDRLDGSDSVLGNSCSALFGGSQIP
jgi:hypothetical protein